MRSFEREINETQEWFDSPRFAGIVRPYTARQVVEQRGTIRHDYTIAREAAAAFYDRLCELFAERKSITTFGPYSPGQAVAMKRMGIEAIYLGGWATSAKGGTSEDPGPDLASYPLSQVPDEAATLVRALLSADRNQQYLRSRMTEAQRAARNARDFRPFIIADADTGHGGDPHVRNLIRRFVEAGVPGYHIEDQRPGTKKCGHQGGKVLVAQDEQNKRLNAARFQLDVMGVPGLIVARTDAEAANLIEGRGDERDQPFLVGATNPNVPAYKPCFLALIQHFHELGVAEFTGHLLYAIPAGEHTVAREWLERRGILAQAAQAVASLREGKETSIEAMFDCITTRFLDAWEDEFDRHARGPAVDLFDADAARADWQVVVRRTVAVRETVAEDEPMWRVSLEDLPVAIVLVALGPGHVVLDTAAGPQLVPGEGSGVGWRTPPALELARVGPQLPHALGRRIEPSS